MDKKSPADMHQLAMLLNTGVGQSHPQAVAFLLNTQEHQSRKFWGWAFVFSIVLTLAGIAYLCISLPLSPTGAPALTLQVGAVLFGFNLLTYGFYHQYAFRMQWWFEELRYETGDCAKFVELAKQLPQGMSGVVAVGRPLRGADLQVMRNVVDAYKQGVGPKYRPEDYAAANALVQATEPGRSVAS